jgi:hypothetical protein
MKDSVRKAIFAKRVNKIVENNMKNRPFGMAIKEDKNNPTFKKGDYVHYKGWGLAKVTGIEPYHDAFAGDVFKYRVNTKTFKNQTFQFGVKTAHTHELSHVSKSDAMKDIKKRKEEERVYHLPLN